MSESKFCMNCGKQIPKDATFCPFCGTAQTEAAGASGTVTNTNQQNTNQQRSTDHSQANRNRVRPEPINMWTALKLGARQTFTWSQRISRPQYWWLYLDLVILSTLISAILGPKVYGYPAFYHAGSSYAALLLLYTALLSWIAVASFTATVRRLHDTNRSAHYLWLGLIPIVGIILIIIALCQPAKAAGERFDHAPRNPKPWTHKWWTWGILLLLTLVDAGGFALSTVYNPVYGYYSQPSTDRTTSTDRTSTADSTTSNSDAKSITIDDDKIKIAGQQAYTTSFDDDSWADSTFSIDKVTVYKTDGVYTNGSGSDKTDFNGIVKVHMGIQAGRDISAYPTQANLSTNDGQQVDADFDSDDFDGDLNAGTNTDGNLYFLLPKLAKVSDLTSIRLKWDASYDTDDDEDDNAFKTFDTTIDFN